MHRSQLLWLTSLLLLPTACVDRLIRDELDPDDVFDQDDPDQDAPDQEDPDQEDPDQGALPDEVSIDCDFEGGDEQSRWRNPDPESPRLWVAGIYETRTDRPGGNDPVGRATVEWSIPGSNVLVVSAYESTEWVIDVVGDGELAEVIAVGYEAQYVVAPSGVQTQTSDYESGDEISACGYALPGDGGGCEGEDLVAAAEALTGLTLHAFDGCYYGSSFTYTVP